MNGRLRRRYERLLFTYPSAYRAAHGEEIISTLLDAARPAQRFPSSRETTSLLLGGLRMRARQAAKESPSRMWTDGLHLGVLLIVLVNLGHALEMPFPLWIALVAVGALAVLRGWTRTALAASAVAGLAVARPLLPQVALPWWLPGLWRLVGGRALRRARRGPGRARMAQGRPPACAIVVVAGVAGRGGAAARGGRLELTKAGLEVGLLLVVLVVVVGALDLRPAIAAAVYLTPGLFFAAESIAAGPPNTLALSYWAVLAALMVGLAAVAWRIRREQLTQR